MGGMRKVHPLATCLHARPALSLRCNLSEWTRREELGQRWPFVWARMLSGLNDRSSALTMLCGHRLLQPAHLRLQSDKFAIDEQLHAAIELDVQLDRIDPYTIDPVKLNARWVELSGDASHTSITLLRRLFAIRGTYQALCDSEAIASAYIDDRGRPPSSPVAHQSELDDLFARGLIPSHHHTMYLPELWKAAQRATPPKEEEGTGDALPYWPGALRENAIVWYGWNGTNEPRHPMYAAWTANPGLVCFDHIIGTFLRCYRFLCGLGDRMPCPDYEIDYAVLLQEFAIPIPDLLFTKKPSILTLLRQGHGLMATMMWRLYHLHRLLRYARRLADVHLFHQTQLLIDSHLPLWSVMVRFQRWSDTDLLDRPLVCENATTPLDETSMHPLSPANLDERVAAFVDVAMDHSPSQANSNPLHRRINALLSAYLRALGDSEAEKTKSDPAKMRQLREQFRAKCVDQDAAMRDRGLQQPNHGVRTLSLKVPAFAFWPLSTDVLTLEECSDMSRAVVEANFFYEDSQRRDEELLSRSLAHLFVGKVLPRKCAMRADQSMSERYFSRHPSIVNQFSLLIQLVSYGNLPDLLGHRPLFATRVRLWQTYKFEMSTQPETWLKFMENHRYVAQHALKEMVAVTISRSPELERVLRRRPNFGLWVSMMRYSCNIWRRRLDHIPYDHEGRLEYRRAITLHNLEIDAILSRIHRIVSKINIKLHKGTFVETMASSYYKFYQGLQAQLEKMKRENGGGNQKTKTGNDNRRMREVHDYWGKRRLMRPLMTQRPAEYDDHMMRIFAWHVARHNRSNVLPTYFLQYFGVADEAIHTVRRWMLYFTVYEMSDNWYQDQISMLWERYPASFCVLWTYMTYVQTFQSETPIVLPQQIVDMQLQARRNALQLTPFEKTTNENLLLFYYCAVCKKWSHPIAPHCSLVHVAAQPGERFLDPIEQAVQKLLVGGKNSLSVEDDEEEDDEEDDEDDDDEDGDETAKHKKKKSRSSARGTISTLGVYGQAPTAYIGTGASSSVGAHTLNLRGGVGINGSGVGITTEASGLYSTDMSRQQYDPIDRKLRCAHDVSKRANMRGHRELFEAPQTYVTSEEHAREIVEYQEPDMSEYLTMEHGIYNDITKLMFQLVGKKQQEKYSLKRGRKLAREQKKKNSKKRVRDDVPAPSSPAVPLDLTDLIDKLDAASKKKDGGGGDDDALEAFSMELEAHMEQNTKLQHLLDRDLHSTLSEISSSVTRARRCRAELIPVKLIGRIFFIKNKPYVNCSQCCAIMLAAPSHYVCGYGFVCSRHGLSNNGFDPKTGTLIASPHAKTQTNVTLDEIGNKGFVRMRPVFYITRASQLNGLPMPWLLRYGYHTPYDAIHNRARPPALKTDSRIMPTSASRGYPFMRLATGLDYGSGTTMPRPFQCDACKDRYYMQTILVEGGNRRLCFKHWKSYLRARAPKK